MKLFQRLLVAPAALGLLAPMAANAAEVNLDSVVDYSNSAVQVATSAQFSDVVPGDWAYTALQNLSESYGCVDNAYTQSLNNGQALTRYEAAALINACLDGGLMADSQGLSSEASRLADEFGSEMAILKGRVDGLEYKVNELSAGQFSSTTKLSGGAVFTVGAVDGVEAATQGENLHGQYAFGLDLNTSFTGQDDLYVGLETGNHAAPLLMDSATTANTAGALEIHALYYSFPVGDFTVTAGPLIDQEDIVSATLSTYSDAFRLAGQPYTLANVETGPGVGATYSNESGFNASFAFVSDDGEGSTTGILTEEGDDVVTASIGYDGDGFGGGIIYTSADEKGSAAGYDAFGYGFYWQPEGMPSINVSWDTKDPETAGVEDSNSMMISSDFAFGPGSIGAAYSISDDDGTNDLDKYELYYTYEHADGVTIQPGIFVEDQLSGDDHTGVVVETFFKF
jgi:hypothetical protein